MSVSNVINIQRARPTSDGDGVKMTRIAGFEQPALSPFLMLDELKSDESSDYIGGFPLHPHRGIETLSYMKTGHFQHKDHLGHIAEISSGGAQWMAAGRGVLHSEMPIMENGELHSFQLWINQPAKLKMTPARYRNLESDELTHITLKPDNNLTLVAGEIIVDGQKYLGPLNETGVPIIFADWVANKERIEVKLSKTLRTHIYVYHGEIKVEGQTISHGELATLSEGDKLILETNQLSGALIISGTPINESVAHYGPFVMNTQDELNQAILDYRNGLFETY